MNQRKVYLDNAAATRLDERVLEAMTPYFFDTYAVATSQFGYSLGIDAKDALEDARATIAARLGASAEEFVFTSGDTESSNMAIKGVAQALAGKKGRHIITTAIEDFPVLYSARSLERQGLRGDLRARWTSTGASISMRCGRPSAPTRCWSPIQAANQEIGTLQDLAAIARHHARARRAAAHRCHP